MAGKIEDRLGMRFMLPEHVTALLDHDFVKTLVPQPMLDNQELEEINYKFMDSIHNDYAVCVSWWAPVRGELGQIKRSWGTVRIIPDLRQIRLTRDDDVAFIRMDRIVSVSEGYCDAE